jgi:type VI protein secretion system component Hcp
LGEATAPASAAARTAVQALDDVCFTFRKIEVENKDAKTTFVDDWTVTS